MDGFKLIDGDLSITNNEIDIIVGNELTAQTIRSILSTNKGEWIFNSEEGIEFYAILGEKEIDEDIIRSEIQQGLSQVDENLTIEDFSCEFDETTRKLKVNFKAKNAKGETMEVSNAW